MTNCKDFLLLKNVLVYFWEILSHLKILAFNYPRKDKNNGFLFALFPFGNRLSCFCEDFIYLLLSFPSKIHISKMCWRGVRYIGLRECPNLLCTVFFFFFSDLLLYPIKSRHSLYKQRQEAEAEFPPSLSCSHACLAGCEQAALVSASGSPAKRPCALLTSIIYHRL